MRKKQTEVKDDSFSRKSKEEKIEICEQVIRRYPEGHRERIKIKEQIENYENLSE